MSTNLKDCLDLISSTVLGDAAIAAFCQSQFRQIPWVFTGIDPRNPPNLHENCPLIAIATGARARESSQNHNVGNIIIGCAIETDTQSRSGRHVKFNGIDDLDDFTNLVEISITKALNAAGYASSQEPTFEDEIIPPFFKSYLSYVIRCPSRIPK